MRIYFKQSLVIFWLIWWLFAFLTDFIGGLELLGLISTPWFDGHNYPFLEKTLEPFGATPAIDIVLFIGIITWALLSALLFLRTAITPYSRKDAWRSVWISPSSSRLAFGLHFFSRTKQ